VPQGAGGDGWPVTKMLSNPSTATTMRVKDIVIDSYRICPRRFAIIFIRLQRLSCLIQSATLPPKTTQWRFVDPDTRLQ
jgi:hypothetical protein